SSSWLSRCLPRSAAAGRSASRRWPLLHDALAGSSLAAQSLLTHVYGVTAGLTSTDKTVRLSQLSRRPREHVARSVPTRRYRPVIIRCAGRRCVWAPPSLRLRPAIGVEGVIRRELLRHVVVVVLRVRLEPGGQRVEARGLRRQLAGVGIGTA